MSARSLDLAHQFQSVPGDLRFCARLRAHVLVDFATRACFCDKLDKDALWSRLCDTLGGAGATVASDAVIHLLCPMSNLSHVLVWHSGAVILFMALGWAAGMIWERRRW